MKIMKSILTLLFLAILQLGYSQTSMTPRGYVEAGVAVNVNGEPITRVSVISPDRDTLWLIDHQIGYLIASTWDIYPTEEKKPVIIFTKNLPEPRTSLAEPSKRKKRKKITEAKKKNIELRSGQASL